MKKTKMNEGRTNDLAGTVSEGKIDRKISDILEKSKVYNGLLKLGFEPVSVEKDIEIGDLEIYDAVLKDKKRISSVKNGKVTTVFMGEKKSTFFELAGYKTRLRFKEDVDDEIVSELLELMEKIEEELTRSFTVEENMKAVREKFPNLDEEIKNGSSTQYVFIGNEPNMKYIIEKERNYTKRYILEMRGEGNHFILSIDMNLASPKERHIESILDKMRAIGTILKNIEK